MAGVSVNGQYQLQVDHFGPAQSAAAAVANGLGAAVKGTCAAVAWGITYVLTRGANATAPPTPRQSWQALSALALRHSEDGFNATVTFEPSASGSGKISVAVTDGVPARSPIHVVFSLRDVVNAQLADGGALKIEFVPRDAPGFSADRLTSLAVLTVNGPNAAALHKAVFDGAFPQGGRRVFTLLCPVSGDGRGVEHWESTAEPLLARSPHTLQVTRTTHVGHAMEWVSRNQELRDGDVVVAAGGDGMMHEIINGVFCRNGKDAATGGQDMNKIRIASFPTGSGCAISKDAAVLGKVDAVLAIIHCHVKPYDLFRATVEDPANSNVLHRRIGFLSTTFASTSAIDIESERFRWMGNGRFLADMVLRCAYGKLFYKATVRYRAATISDLPEHLRRDESLRGGRAVEAQRLDGVVNIIPHRVLAKLDDTFAAIDEKELGEIQPSQRAAQPDAEGWVTVPHNMFALCFAGSIPWLAQDLIGLPFANRGDGCIDFGYSVEGMTRGQYTYNVGMILSNTFYRNPLVHLVKAKELEITPADGYFSLDGENLAPVGRTRIVVLRPEERALIVTGPTVAP